MKSFLIPATGLFLLACSGASAPSSYAADEPAPIKASKPETTPISEVQGNWIVNPRESHLKFSALQEGKTFTGEFPRFSAVINFDPDALESSSVYVKVPLKFVEAGSTDRNSTLPDKVWFSTKAFPFAEFNADTITQTGEGTYLADGTLTMKGEKQALKLPFNLAIDAGQAVMTSTISIDRTLWNVGAEPWNTDEWVSREVKLDIKISAGKAG